MFTFIDMSQEENKSFGFDKKKTKTVLISFRLDQEHNKILQDLFTFLEVKPKKDTTTAKMLDLIENLGKSIPTWLHLGEENKTLQKAQKVNEHKIQLLESELKESHQKSLTVNKNNPSGKIWKPSRNTFYKDPKPNYGTRFVQKPPPNVSIDGEEVYLETGSQDDQLKPKAQPIKSEPNKSEAFTPTQVVQKPLVVEKPKEIPEQPQKIEPRHMIIDQRACPLKSEYVRISINCEECRKSNSKAYVECYKYRAKIQARMISDQIKALYQFALIPNTNSYQIEKAKVE